MFAFYSIHLLINHCILLKHQVTQFSRCYVCAIYISVCANSYVCNILKISARISNQLCANYLRPYIPSSGESNTSVIIRSAEFRMPSFFKPIHFDEFIFTIFVHFTSISSCTRRTKEKKITNTHTH